MGPTNIKDFTLFYLKCKLFKNSVVFLLVSVIIISSEPTGESLLSSGASDEISSAATTLIFIRACSIVVTRVHGMDESGVRFPPGPPG